MGFEEAKAFIKSVMLPFESVPPTDADRQREVFRRTVLAHKAGFSQGRLCHPRLPNGLHGEIEAALVALVPDLGDKASHYKFGITERTDGRSAGASIDVQDEHGRVMLSVQYRNH